MAMQTSPMLKTLWSGQDFGIAKMSPRKSSLGCASRVEFTKPFGPATSPAARSALAEAGMTPWFTAMAVAFSSAQGDRPHSGRVAIRTEKRGDEEVRREVKDLV